MSKSKIGKRNTKKAPPPNDVSLWCVDWEAFYKIQGSEVVATMMICLNDLHSATYLATLVDRDERENKHLSANHSGNHSFLLRIQTGVLWAAHEYFIEQSRQQKEIKKFIDTTHKEQPDIEEHFNEFARITREPNFRWFVTMRNNFAFHLNYKKNGKLTKEAIAEKYQEIVDRGLDSKSLVGLQKTDRVLENRYILGDSVLIKAWRKACGDVPDSDDFNDDKTKAVREYTTSVGRAFVIWAQDFVHHFLEKNNLIVGEAQSAFKLFEDAAVGSKLSY